MNYRNTFLNKTPYEVPLVSPGVMHKPVFRWAYKLSGSCPRGIITE